MSSLWLRTNVTCTWTYLIKKGRGKLSIKIYTNNFLAFYVFFSPKKKLCSSVFKLMAYNGHRLVSLRKNFHKNGNLWGANFFLLSPHKVFLIFWCEFWVNSWAFFKWSLNWNFESNLNVRQRMSGVG